MGAERLDLFISYQKADTEFATKLATAIEGKGEGLKVFFAPWDIPAGSNVVKELDAGLSKAKYFGLVMSPEYLRADWTTGEASAAIYTDPGGRLGRVIPLMQTHCQLPPLLRFRRYVDFEGLGFDLGVDYLVSVLKGRPLPRGRGASAATVGAGVIEGRPPALSQLDASQPDAVADCLYPNVFPVTTRPEWIWNAPTRMKSPRDLFQYYGHGRSVPPFILAAGRLFTFADLSKANHPFTGVIEEYDTAREPWQSWVTEGDRSKRLHWLLDDCLREKLRGLRLAYERKGRKYYYEKGVLKEGRFKAFSRGKGKDFVIDYTEKGGTYVAHRAVNLRFVLLGSEPYLRVESGWVFKDAGGDLIEGRRRVVLNAKFTSGQRNTANFNEIRFWLWFLAGDEPVLSLDVGGGQSLAVRVSQVPLEVDFGILGDERELSPIRGAPDIHFEDEDSPTEEEDTDPDVVDVEGPES